MNTTDLVKIARAADYAMVARRIEILDATLRARSNESVQWCIEDALHCLAAADAGSPFPGTMITDTERLWIEAATKWVNRAGQHAFGFALPAGW